MTPNDIIVEYMPLAEKMAGKYFWDEEATTRAYYGLVLGANALPLDHPNPGGFLAGYIKSQLILKKRKLAEHQLAREPYVDNANVSLDYLIEEIVDGPLEKSILTTLSEGYTIQETADILGLTFYSVRQVRNQLQERYDELGK